jgi:peptide/nickel transport system substrate-binding protein
MVTRFCLLILVLLVGACAPSAAPSAAPARQAAPSAATRPLSILVGREPTSLSLKALGQPGGTVATSRRLFNATLAIVDPQGAALPYLAESLPQLNSASWQVSADGRMETTYPLKPNLAWHDGTPLTADDFVFAWRMYAEPQLGQAASVPMNSIDEVAAPDPRTVLIRWKRPFPLAGSLQGEFPPVPQHVLQAPFDQLQSGAMPADAFIRQPYWTTEFVGAGPYKLERWESGVSIDASAFDGHVLGKPKIQRLTVGFSGDANASLARLMAGYADYVSDTAIGSPQAVTLRRSWADTKGGSIFTKLDFFRGSWAQVRPEQAVPAAMMDVRVRQALAYGVDKQALHDGLDGFDGGSIDADAPFIPPTASYYTHVERAVTKYPHDPRRVEQLMSEAGLTKGGDGYYQSPSEGRLHWEIKTSGSVDNETEISILASTWRTKGFDFQQAILPAALAQDGQARATFPTLYSFGTAGTEIMLSGMNTAGIPRADNRWTGSNRGGWSNAEFDRLSETLTLTLEPDRRAQLVAQMAGIFSREMVAIPLYFYGYPVAATSNVVGLGPVVQETTFEWNIHQWVLTQ